MVAAWHFDLSSHAEHSLFTGADDGRVVLKLMKTFRIRPYLASIFSVSVSVTQVVDIDSIDC